MQPSLYVSLSGQLALQRRLETIANNVANSATVGFRAEEVKFESWLSRTTETPIAFASLGSTRLSRAPGDLKKTGNPLDVAIEGNAWFGLGTPAGTVYTRDGRMKISETGELRSITGNSILDVGGAPIIVDPNLGPLRIARDGTITQDNRQIGAIGLFVIDERATLTRFEGASVIPDRPATPALDFSSVGIVQGHVEGANVNPVAEITRLIAISRAFDAAAASISEAESSLKDSIRGLGPTS